MSMKSTLDLVRGRLRLYWSLTKSFQTGLLLSTGLAGYMSAHCPVIHWKTLLGLAGSLFLSIAGSTIINMWFDRDIDSRMGRTCARPLPAGKVSPQAALRFGLVLSLLGVSLAVAMDPRYGLVVFAGLCFDVVIYTVWLKRRTAWSIVWGGLAGGMPILAGRVLGTGQIDAIGVLLCLAVLFWIPTHILSFNMRYFADYKSAGIPTFPSAYGFKVTRGVIAFSSVLAALAIAAACILIGMDWGYLRLLAVLAGGLLILAVVSLVRPSERINFSLFKYASVYMFGAMLLISLGAL